MGRTLPHHRAVRGTLMTTAAIASGPTAASGARAGIPTALTPTGAQAVFRATLDVLARPGTVKRLPSATDEPLAEHVPAALLPLLALADLSTPTCVVDSDADGRTAWDEIVRVATNAPRAALGDARLVTALRPLTAEELAGLRTGTAPAPKDGALACLAVAGIAASDDTDGVASAGDEVVLLRLSGPGVPETRTVIVSGLPPGVSEGRRRL